MAFEESKMDRRRLNRISEQHEEITQLKADLAKYGGHTAACAFVLRTFTGKYYVKCECGWAEVKHD